MLLETALEEDTAIVELKKDIIKCRIQIQEKY